MTAATSATRCDRRREISIRIVRLHRAAGNRCEAIEKDDQIRLELVAVDTRARISDPYDAAAFFIEQFARWRKGEPLKNVVDKRAGY